MAFFRPLLSDPFFASPASSLLSPASSLLFDDEPLFAATPLYLYDHTPRRAGRRAQGSGGRQQQQLKEQQVNSGDNAQAMVSGASSSGKSNAAGTAAGNSTPSVSPSSRQAAVTGGNSNGNSNSNSNSSNSHSSNAVSSLSRQQARLLSPLSLLSSFSPAASLLSSGAVLPSMSVDMSSTDAEYRVHASVPGVSKADLRVTVEDGVLTIEAERREETTHSGSGGRQGNNNGNSITQQAQQSAGSRSATTSDSADEEQREEKTDNTTTSSTTTPAAATQPDGAAMETEDDSSSPVYHHVESFYGHISRAITLPDDCNTDGMAARYEDGVLRISIPRVQEKRARATRLEIQ